MSSAPEEPPDPIEDTASGNSQPDNVKDICEDNKSQLETFKDIMLKNKNDLKRKEEELQEYASKLSEIKSRAKLSRRSKDGGLSSVEPSSKAGVESALPEGDEVDDISQAKTPKAKSSLLQRKLAENRKVFEKRSKEMTASKRAVEEKVEAIRQQMDQTDLTIVEAPKDSPSVTPVRPVLVTQILPPPVMQLGHLQDKDNKIAELSNRILELEATVIDLQDNLKEKDSVIESKMRAVTLMSADLSKKGKTTLDILEDTKDEMRTMQENFVLLETSLKGKNDNLLEQLQERNARVADLEITIKRYEGEMEERRLADNTNASLSRSTMDTLADTKDAMRSMQENFVLIETSLKNKIDNLLQQLQDRETKLAEAEEKMYKYESGAGFVTAPEIPDLQYKIDRLEQSNRALQDEKYELQKSITKLQEKIVARESSNGNGLILEKDNRIAELENLIEELKSSNQLLEEESKAELQKQVAELTSTNEEFRNKIDEVEKLNNDLEIKMNELRAKIPEESDVNKEDAMVKKLTKELDDLNKSMIKLKAQHKSKLRNLQKQVDGFKMVSDANAELVKLANQVALLEEEKGNLQLSLVDFDELKASAGDWQDQIADLEIRVSTQANHIQAHIGAIAILENQKLDLMQELHTVKQDISALEAENAESENLRVTAEMKVVDLEEQLESLDKSHKENQLLRPGADSDREQLLIKIEQLIQENNELMQKVAKLEEKPTSEAGSTESFETIHEDRNEMLRKIETLSSRNSELEENLAKAEEAARSNVGSTESFETINDTDKSELIKKIDLLSRENSDLVTKLNKLEEKGSSDTGSTESFEKIPEHGDSLSRIHVLTRENNELVIKLTKIEERYENLQSRLSETPRDETREENSETERKLENLIRENNDLVIELTKAQEKLARFCDVKECAEKRLEDSQKMNVTFEDVVALETRIDNLTKENNELVIKLVKLEEKNNQLSQHLQQLAQTQADNEKILETSVSSTVTVASLEGEIEECRKLIAEQTELIEEMKIKLADKETELEGKMKQISEYEVAGISVEDLRRELKDSFGVIEEWKLKCAEMEGKMEILEAGKISIEDGLRLLQEENKELIEQSKQKDYTAEILKHELDNTIATFETRLEEKRDFIEKREHEITNLQTIIESKDKELHDKYLTVHNEIINIDALQDELNDWKNQLQYKETTIASLNEQIMMLNDIVASGKEETLSAQAEIIVLREELQSKAAKEAKNKDMSRLLSDKENLVEEIKTALNQQLEKNAELKNVIENTNTEVINLRRLLAEKNSKVAALESEKSILVENLQQQEIAKSEIEGRCEFFNSSLDQNNEYILLLKTEIKAQQTKIEELEDDRASVEMTNTKLSEISNDLVAKHLECEVLLKELEGKNSKCETMCKQLEEKIRYIDDLERKLSEFEVVRRELAEKEKMIGQNVTEEVKIALELKVRELEKKLEESEANTQTQLQKRKILAANLKKKSSEVAEHETKAAQLEAKAAAFEATIIELESKAAEYEEKWILEKSEKEATNLKIQEIYSLVQDRDHAIFQLEEQLQTAQREAARASERVEELSNELRNSTDKMNVLMDQITDMGEEVERLKTEIQVKSSEIETERIEKDRIIAEYDSCRQKIVDEEIQRQQVLEEAKEKARELGVRMQVMETEYVDQLITIQLLRTENGMLVSKQAQISERLENSEKEAAEQKILLDQLQRETTTTVETENGQQQQQQQQQQEPTSSEDDQADPESKTSTSQSCDHCDQCQTVVQALEAKLQERDAEIENLDNELANSIGNFVHMRESLRVSDLMNQSSSRNRTLEDPPRDTSDLAFQYNALTASNTEIRDQLNVTIQENQDLKEKIASLQALNSALQERTGAVEEELIEGREATTRLHAVDVLHTELMEKCRLRESELQSMRSELEVTKQRHEDWMSGMESQVEQLESENRKLIQKCDSLISTNDIVEGEVGTLREKVDFCERRILELETEVEKYKQENIKLIEGAKPSEKSAPSLSSFFEHKEKEKEKEKDGPQLFDAAKAFGICAASDSSGQKEIADLRNIVTLKDAENVELTEEVRRLKEQLVNQRQSHGEWTCGNCERLQNDLTRLEQILDERTRQVHALNSQLNNIGVQIAAQYDHQGNTDMLKSTLAQLRSDFEEQSNRLSVSEVAVENLTAANQQIAAQLQSLQAENLNYFNIIDVVCSAGNNVEEEIDADRISEIRIDEFSPIVKEKVDKILYSLVALKQEKSNLIGLQETCKQRILALQRDAESSNDATRVQELEERVDSIMRERDIKQLQVNDLTRSLEEMQESMENASSREESRLRNLQAALDKALSEHESLNNVVQLETMRQEREKTRQQAEPEKLLDATEIKSAQQLLESTEVQGPGITNVESGWDDEARLDVDEEIWSWNPEDAQLAADDDRLAMAPLKPSVEITLKTRIAELEDTIKDLESERDKLAEEFKTGQIRSGKLVKKLKEFKIQNESLQQQLKIQKASSGFGDLDSAIEEELKAQITTLEKSLNEAKDEHKKSIAERDNLTKRIDVLSAANERLVEMKERQDMEVQVLKIRTKELANKLQAVEWQLKESCGDETEFPGNPASEGQINVRQIESLQGAAPSRILESAAAPVALDCLCNKYKEEIDEVRDEMEALAAENEQLQRLLEEQKSTRQSIESKYAGELAARDKDLEQLMGRRNEFEKELENAKRDYNNLRNQCDQSAKNSDERTCAIQQSHEMLKVEIAEKTNAFEAQIAVMRGQIEAASLQINVLQEHLETLSREKQELIERTRSYEETEEKLLASKESMAEVTELLNARVQEVAQLKRDIQKLKNDKNEALDTVEGLAQNHTRELTEKQREAQEYLHQCEAQLTEKSNEILQLRDTLREIQTSNVGQLNEKIQENLQLQSQLAEAVSERMANVIHVQNLREEIERLNNALTESRLHRESLQSELAGKEQQAFRHEDEIRKYSYEIERLNDVVVDIQKSSANSLEEANGKIREIEKSEIGLKKTIDELTARESDALAQMYREISEKDGKVAMLQQTVSNLEKKIHDVTSSSVKEKTVELPETVENLTVCRIMTDGSKDLHKTVEQLKAELSRKNEEIEDYKYQLSESTYPSIIQALQDQVNQLYEEKTKLEVTLNSMVENTYGGQGQKNSKAEVSMREEEERRLQEVGELKLKMSTTSLKSEETFVSMLRSKETEIHNLKVAIEEKGKRFRELHDHYESAMVEINELRIRVATKEEEVRMVRMQLEAMSKERELLQRALKKDISGEMEACLERSESSAGSTTEATKEQQSSNELDLALYMLHQRDVRVEELTHELMQLLEERDTLQLRLSNAIRINEELRRAVPTDAAVTSETLHGIGDVEPLVEKPSPSKSVGPVEIAKEAIDSPSEEKIALAQKLSQLHNMGHRRDVRLMDDRELRHNQQMSLLAHRDVLNNLPPEAAARLVNANYTLSRDVQSQSSVLMNWLWGKSTPKVVHM